MPTIIGYPPDAILNLTSPGNDLTTGDSFQLDASFTFASDGLTFEITDEDTLFEGDATDPDGDDATQSAQIYDALGNLIDSGQVYLEEAVEFTVGGQPVELYPVMIGTVVVGWVTTASLVPGDTHVVDNVDNINAFHEVEYSTLFVCYAPGTPIDTPDGPRTVETLRPGDMVNTLDHGPQIIRWVHSGEHPLEDAEDEAKPVQIKAGALGRNLPAQDMIVSPQHRILVGGVGQLSDVFASEVFAPAKSLTAVPGIRHMKGKTQITWVHFACDRHEVVTANGCLSESLLLGPMVVNGLSPAERESLTDIFGPAATPDAALNGPPARECLTVGAVKRQIAKHLKEKGAILAKEIRKWDRDLAMERYETERLRVAASMAHPREKVLRVA